MKYDKVRKTPSQLLSLTEFTSEEFEAVAPTFEYHWNEYYSHFTLKDRLRYKTISIRIINQLSFDRNKLLFILSYLKNNPLQEYRETTYRIIQSQCNEWVHRLSDILLKSLKILELNITGQELYNDTALYKPDELVDCAHCDYFCGVPYNVTFLQK